MNAKAYKLLKRFYSFIGKEIRIDEVDELRHSLFGAYDDLDNFRVVCDKLDNLSWFMMQNELDKVVLRLKDGNLKRAIKLQLKQFESRLRKSSEALTLDDLHGIPFKPKPIEESIAGVSPAEIYKMISDKVIEGLQKSGDWIKSWNSGNKKEGYIIAYNFITKKAYKSMNQVILGAHPLFGFEPLKNPYYLTFKQINKLGGKIKKGAMASKAIYYTVLYKIDTPDHDFGTYEKNKFLEYFRKNGLRKEWEDQKILNYYSLPILKYYNVFNGSDITGIDFDLDNFALPGKLKKAVILKRGELEPLNEIAEGIIKNYPKPAPKITDKRQGRAFYDRSKDSITMPLKGQFKGMNQYYGTLFHELIHSTGSPDRLNREKGKKFGDKNYSFEELIAEIGSSFLSAESGILHDNIKNTQAYLANWNEVLIKEFKEDPKAIFRASSLAEKATEFILQRNSEGVPLYFQKKKQKTKTKPNTIKIPEKTKKSKIDKTKRSVVKKTKTKVDKQGQTSLFGLKGTDSLFVRASEKMPAPANTFKLKGEKGKLLGNLQRFRLAIVLTGDPHAGKSEFAKDLLDGFLDLGMTVGMFDLEQGGRSSKDTEASINRNISKDNQERLFVAGEAPKGIDTIKQYAKSFDVIMIDSFQKLGIPSTRFDELRLEFPETIWVVIFQQNGEGGTRGGVSADYDTPVKAKVHKLDDTFVNNYVEIEKNRGNEVGLCYSPANKKAFRFDSNGKRVLF